MYILYIVNVTLSYFSRRFFIHIIRTFFFKFYPQHTFQDAIVEYCGRVKPLVSSKMCEYSQRLFKSYLLLEANRWPTFVCFHLRRKRLLGIRVGLEGGWRAAEGGGRRCVWAREKETGGYRFPGGGWWGIDDRIASTPAEPITRLNLHSLALSLSPLHFPPRNYISLAFIALVYPNADR